MSVEMFVIVSECFNVMSVEIIHNISKKYTQKIMIRGSNVLLKLNQLNTEEGSK